MAAPPVNDYRHCFVVSPCLWVPWPLNWRSCSLEICRRSDVLSFSGALVMSATGEPANCVLISCCPSSGIWKTEPLCRRSVELIHVAEQARVIKRRVEWDGGYRTEITGKWMIIWNVITLNGTSRVKRIFRPLSRACRLVVDMGRLHCAVVTGRKSNGCGLTAISSDRMYGLLTLA